MAAEVSGGRCRTRGGRRRTMRPRSTRAASAGRREVVGVRFEEGGEPRERRRSLGGRRCPCGARSARSNTLTRRARAGAQDLDGGDRDVPRTASVGSIAERGLGRRGVERGLDGGLEERVLVGEDPEDGALGDAGGLRDLPRRRPPPVLRNRGRAAATMAAATLLDGQRGRPGPVPGICVIGCHYT